MTTSIKRARLSDLAVGRENHFNLIRFLAAGAVLVSHAWPLALGRGTVEPLKNALGYSLGELAVFVFFGLSGFFIAGSFARQSSVFAFILARASRLLPGLAVSILFVALIIGPLVSTLDLASYFSDPETGRFVVQNILIFKPQYTLPGVFTDNPYPAVEGSIWTLAHEVACYALILLLGLAGVLQRKSMMAGLAVLYLLSWVAVPTLQEFVHPRIQQTQVLSFPFVIGAACWIWRAHIFLWWPIVLVSIGLAWATQGTVLAFPMLALTVTYSSLWAGYCRVPPLLMFNKVGDYSYGIYVYAMPLQGLTVWLWGDVTPVANIAMALPLTLICAIISWHWVENPALTFAGKVVSAGNSLGGRKHSPDKGPFGHRRVAKQIGRIGHVFRRNLGERR